MRASPTLVKLEEAEVSSSAGKVTFISAIEKRNMLARKYMLPTSQISKRGREIWVPQWLADKEGIYYL